ncbi:MAG: serine/threonine protein kinase [Pirellulales bacterium]|nr:serine/threonine protein kinase [Pirellulales bacterium]
MGHGRDFIDQYRIVRLIRSGATCQIFESVDGNTRQKVALKVLTAQARQSKVERRYLQHEYNVASKLDHDNVIEVFGVRTTGNDPYLSLEFGEQLNLKQRLRIDRELMQHHADVIIEQSAMGLDHLHEQQWVHCDIKPDNYLVDDDGRTKLIDFALCQPSRTGFLAKLGVGKPKEIAGTRSYMSPEQIRRRPLDIRSDIYSLGCMYFEIVTGKLPFTGNSPEQLLTKHLKAKAPPANTLNKNVTPEFSDLIEDMMRKKKEQRPNNLKTVLRHLSTMRVFRSKPLHPSEITPEEDEA